MKKDKNYLMWLYILFYMAVFVNFMMWYVGFDELFICSTLAIAAIGMLLPFWKIKDL
tara:strand:+ start:3920 stop:4090 length:171 start_codon:yes stop_codon:yes gene_type:complete